MPVHSERRPWGKFERFIMNERCTVKLIYLSADKKLSLQYHNRRKEFWKVVQGPVRVQIGDNLKTIHTGESIEIPEKAIHRLMGAGVDAIVLEIATGDFD